MRIVTCVLVIIGLIGGSSAVNAMIDTPRAITARLLTSNPSPYLGEEIDLMLAVTYNRHPGGRSRIDWPNLDNFINSDQTRLRSTRSRDTRNRLVETVFRRVRPLKSGRLILKGATISVGKQTFEADPLTLRVKPLPSNGKPAKFDDVVGTYRLKLSADGVGPREIRLHIYSNSQQNSIPHMQSWPEIGQRLILLETKTKPFAGNGQEQILSYYYTPDDRETDELRFALSTFDPQQNAYRIVETGPAEKKVPWTFLTFSLAGLIFFSIGLAGFRIRRYPRNIDGCLERLCQTPVSGLSQDDILDRLQTLLDQDGQHALKSYWQSMDALRFRHNRSTRETGSDTSIKSLRRQLWKAIDKQHDNP
jgi:hypothetical protein